MTPVTPGLSWLVGWQETFFEVAVSTIQPGASAETLRSWLCQEELSMAKKKAAAKKAAPKKAPAKKAAAKKAPAKKTAKKAAAKKTA